MTNSFKQIFTIFTFSIFTFSASAQFNPKINFGVTSHMYLKSEQVGFSAHTESDKNSNYEYGVGINHLRLMFDVRLSEKDFLFVQTENNAIIGTDGEKSITLRIIDAMYTHKFADEFRISAGKILAAYNRNNIQSTSTLLANDFGAFQCEWNNSMQDDAGRSIGVAFEGSLFNDKVVYNISPLLGRKFLNDEGEECYQASPIRFMGRLQYNFFDNDSYAGTNLGVGKTLSVGVGFDTQGKYLNGGIDAYLDMKVGSIGSLTANLAFSSMTGGSDEDHKHHVEGIPAKDVYFAELGYYFKDYKLQPWVKYELKNEKNGGVNDAIYGAGLSYYFNGYNTNIKVGYSLRDNSQLDKMYGQAMLSLHLFIL